MIVCKGIKKNGKHEGCPFIYEGNWGDEGLIKHEKFHELNSNLSLLLLVVVILLYKLYILEVVIFLFLVVRILVLFSVSCGLFLFSAIAFNLKKEPTFAS